MFGSEAPGDDAIRPPHAATNGGPAGTPLFSGPDAPELVAELAHTLRSHLTPVVLLAESLYASAAKDGNDARREALALLYGAAFGASAFAGHVMELARGGDDLAGREPEPLSIVQLLDDVCDALRPITDHRALAVRVRAAEPDDRIGHPIALNHVLVGLAVATLEHTEHGSLELAARPAGTLDVDFTIRAPAARVDPDAIAVLDRPVEPRSGQAGWHWSTAGVAVSCARQLLRKMNAGLRIDAGTDRGLSFRFRMRLPPVDRR
ncbi:MAG TPA: hypothetical protein VF212_06365 [Longimicrobiales bacterium]